MDRPNRPLLTSISVNRCISGSSRRCGMTGSSSWSMQPWRNNDCVTTSVRGFCCVGLAQPVHPQALTRRPKQDQQQPIPPFRLRDVDRGHPIPKRRSRVSRKLDSIVQRLAYCLISVPAGTAASLAARHHGSIMSRARTHTTVPT
jgi:hypothetical protein